MKDKSWLGPDITKAREFGAIHKDEKKAQLAGAAPGTTTRRDDGICSEYLVLRSLTAVRRGLCPACNSSLSGL